MRVSNQTGDAFLAWSVPCRPPLSRRVRNCGAKVDDNASRKAALNVSITITQGTGTTETTILQTGTLNPGANTPGIVVISGGTAVGPGNCATATCVAPVAGKATMKVTTQVGKARATTGTAIFQFQ